MSLGRRNTVAFLVGAALVPAFASGNAKTFPGSFCVEADDTAPEVMYMSTGSAAAYNQNATHDGEFFCPVVRDDTTGSAGVTGEVFVDDGHGSESVRCRLHSVSGDVQSQAMTGVASSGNAHVGFKLLPVGTLTASQTWSKGYYVFSCTVPNTSSFASGVIHYYTSEG